MAASLSENTFDAAREKLIVALDVPTASEARSVASELDGNVGAFKIGLQLFTAAGPDLVREFVGSGKRVFLDLKFHDIPNTVAMASVEAVKMGVWMFNVHTSGGSDMMARAVEAAKEYADSNGLSKPLMIGVTVLTSSGTAGSADEKAVELAKSAEKAGMDGVVASAHEAAMIRKNAESADFVIVTPGVRPFGATNDDQARVMTPEAAIRAGADHIVVGRPILNSKDRAAAALAIIDEIAAALK
ncbi:MAG: orotidine-5'-phosphate decarboxylase [Acidobacteria bacterium]|nr:orotidine-5'-phosphate decarboxylase [Acidobacteriota bacterium]